MLGQPARPDLPALRHARPDQLAAHSGGLCVGRSCADRAARARLRHLKVQHEAFQTLPRAAERLPEGLYFPRRVRAQALPAPSWLQVQPDEAHAPPGPGPGWLWLRRSRSWRSRGCFALNGQPPLAAFQKTCWRFPCCAKAPLGPDATAPSRATCSRVARPGRQQPQPRPRTCQLAPATAATRKRFAPTRQARLYRWRPAQ